MLSTRECEDKTEEYVPWHKCLTATTGSESADCYYENKRTRTTTTCGGEFDLVMTIELRIVSTTSCGPAAMVTMSKRANGETASEAQTKAAKSVFDDRGLARQLRRLRSK